MGIQGEHPPAILRLLKAPGVKLLEHGEPVPPQGQQIVILGRRLGHLPGQRKPVLIM
jgi:hypothetical protein